jgi:hypothetical protein
VNFADGSSTATVTVDPTSDSTVEANETVILTVIAGAGYGVGSPSVATGTIANDDTDVSVAVTPSATAEDGATNLVYTFTRTGLTSGTLTVNFSVGGTASFGTDYTQSGAAAFNATAGTVTFGAGSSTAAVTVDPSADTTVEANETVVLTVTTGTGYNTGSPSAATGTITSDDTDVKVSVLPSSVAEDGPTNLVYTFTRTGVTASALTVNFSVGGNGSFGTDYAQTGASAFNATGGTVLFAAGSETKTVTVDPSADATVEPNETVILTLASGAGYNVATPSTATGTINNDDNTTPVFMNVTPTTQTVDYSDAIAAVTFTVSDVETSAASLQVTATGLPAGVTLVQTAGTGQWTISGNANVAAGNYSINLKVTDAGSAFATTTVTIVVAKEKTATAYTGDQNIMTASPTITTATVRLRAHLTEQADGFAGDITKAKVIFELFKNGNLGGTPDLIVSDVAVDSSGDALATVNALAADTYNINVKVVSTNTFWVHSNVDIGILNITVPTNDRRSNGGGWVPDSMSSNGKANFGFTVRPGNGNAAAPKGNSTFVFRGLDGYNYLVKGNSWQAAICSSPPSPGQPSSPGRTSKAAVMFRR